VVRVLAVMFVVFLFGADCPAAAALSKSDLAGIEAAPSAGATLPRTLSLQDERGEAKPLQQWLGTTPSVWILADYTCQTLCGPILGIVSGALQDTGLRPGTDFRLIVVGLDPKDSAADARAMKEAQLGTDGAFARQALFLRAAPPGVAELTRALGIRSVYDREHDQFAHPAAAYVVTPAGQVARVLSGLAVDPTDLRLALVDAGQGRVGTWVDHIRLMCYGFDPARGVYTAAVGRMLATAGAVSVLAIALLILALSRREAARQRE
jgi:protein SCO1/2